MSDSSKHQQINNKVVEVMVQSVFKKNGVDTEKVKKNITEEQRQMLKEMVEELKQQVDEFQQRQNEAE